jgi:tRNA dimethylallyltransferase
MNSKAAIFLMGPTAAGKTNLAMRLAQHLPIDLISVDSAMVYRGMDIGTGKPTAAELARFPHALIDICDPSEPYSAAQFCNDATMAMQQSWQHQRIPLLVGGTMLYFKALQFGLSALPSANPDMRAQLAAEAQQIGWPAMHAKLANIDPIAAQILKPNDSQRIQRALEINLLTGKTLQENYQQQANAKLNYKLHTFALMPEDRAWLHNQIAQRFDLMLDQGLIEEVQGLKQRGDLTVDLPSMRAVGYRQVWNYLDDQIDLATMREQAIAATRQLAKRQYTWLRSWPNVSTFTNYSASDHETLDTITNSVLHSRDD